jgi:hypothetical protein
MSLAPEPPASGCEPPRTARLGLVVMIAKLRTLSPAGERQFSHGLASAILTIRLHNGDIYRLQSRKMSIDCETAAGLVMV